MNRPHGKNACRLPTAPSPSGAAHLCRQRERGLVGITCTSWGGALPADDTRRPTTRVQSKDRSLATGTITGLRKVTYLLLPGLCRPVQMRLRGIAASAAELQRRAGVSTPVPGNTAVQARRGDHSGSARHSLRRQAGHYASSTVRRISHDECVLRNGATLTATVTTAT